MSQVMISELRTPEQAAQVVRLSRMELAETFPDRLDMYDESVVLRHLDAQIRDIDRLYQNCWVAYQSGLEDAIGFCYAYCAPFYYTDTDKYAKMGTVYVDPAYRGTYAAYRMIQQYERWATDNGAAISALGVEREQMNEALRIQGIFPRLKYKWSGSFYIRRL